MSEQVHGEETEAASVESQSESEPSAHDASRREMLSAAVKFSGIMAGIGLCGQTLLSGSEAQAAKLPKDQRVRKKDLPPIVDPKSIEGPGLANVEVNGEALRSLLNEAFAGGSMSKAIKKWGAKTKLPKDVLADLGKISDADIKALGLVRQQLDASLNGIAVESMWTVHEHATYRKKK